MGNIIHLFCVGVDGI